MDSQKPQLRIFGRKMTAGTLLLGAFFQAVSLDWDVRPPLFVRTLSWSSHSPNIPCCLGFWGRSGNFARRFWLHWWKVFRLRQRFKCRWVWAKGGIEEEQKETHTGNAGAVGRGPRWAIYSITPGVNSTNNYRCIWSRLPRKTSRQNQGKLRHWYVSSEYMFPLLDRTLSTEACLRSVYSVNMLQSSTHTLK